MDKADFLLTPLQGLGSLAFGSEPDIAKAFADRYGGIREFSQTPLREQRSIPSAAETVDYFGKQNIPRLIRHAAARLIFNHGLLLDFFEDELTVIRLVNDGLQAFFGDVNLFKGEPKDIIYHMMETLDEVPYMTGAAVVFHQHALSMFGYYDFNTEKWSAPDDTPMAFFIEAGREPVKVARSNLSQVRKLKR